MFAIYSSFEFTFKNTSLATVWDFRLMRWFLDSRPAAENTILVLAEPLGMLNTVWATLAMRGKEFSFQKSRTSASGFSLWELRYFSTSPLASPGAHCCCSLKYDPHRRALLLSSGLGSRVAATFVTRQEECFPRLLPKGGCGSLWVCCRLTHLGWPTLSWHGDLTQG